ncbi:MAG: hypothetical protein AAF685_13465 [Cyanobacteria bacterium P01_C01_bin.89]
MGLTNLVGPLFLPISLPICEILRVRSPSTLVIRVYTELSGAAINSLRCDRQKAASTSGIFLVYL